MSKNSLQLGIAGLGTVGGGVVKLVQAHARKLQEKCGRPVEIAGVSARDKAKDRGFKLPDNCVWHEDPVALAGSGTIDIFVELIGGEDGVAKAAVEAALAAGKHVVSANKALLAHHGAALARQAEAQGLALNFEAAIAGGVPVVKVLREGLAANRLSRVVGILNGTCNYILTTMQREGRDFAQALAEAQKLGYAEADPSFDIGGIDSAHKLALLTSIAFGSQVDFESIYIEGIANIEAADMAYAHEFGYRIKLLGIALRAGDKIEQRVHPVLVARDSAIADVDGVFNAVVAEGDFVGSIMLEGRGAGEGPTASAVVADIIDIARGIVLPPFGRPSEALIKAEAVAMKDHRGAYYVRLQAQDHSGAMAAISSRFAEHNVSIESMIQRHIGPATPVPGIMPMAIISHEVREQSIVKALQAIEDDGHIEGKPRLIRIEAF